MILKHGHGCERTYISGVDVRWCGFWNMRTGVTEYAFLQDRYVSLELMGDCMILEHGCDACPNVSSGRLSGRESHGFVCL